MTLVCGQTGLLLLICNWASVRTFCKKKTVTIYWSLRKLLLANRGAWSRSEPIRVRSESVGGPRNGIFARNIDVKTITAESEKLETLENLF